MKPPITTVRELGKYVGQSVTLRGWVYSKRSSGKVKFLMFRDGSGTVQFVLVTGQTPSNALEDFEKLTQETSLIVTGKVREEKRAKGGYELDLETKQANVHRPVRIENESRTSLAKHVGES